MKPICMAKVGSLNLQRDKAVDNGGLRYGAIESALRPPLPTATPSLRPKGTPFVIGRSPIDLPGMIHSEA